MIRPSGRKEPFGFFSQKLLAAQQKYSIYDRKLFAIWAPQFRWESQQAVSYSTKQTKKFMFSRSYL